MQNLPFSATRIEGGFWKHFSDRNRDVTIHAVYNRLAETGRFDALTCSWKPGQPNQPHIYWDSDVAKWIEAVAYLTRTWREPELEAIVDAAVEQMEKNQKPSGYFNSYYITVEPGVEFHERDNHELYCLGHLIEAAVAYDRATGKDRFLKVVCRAADYVYRRFYVEKNTDFVTPGHEEIELALILLADHTGEIKYLELAKFFIDQRGANPSDSPILPELGPRIDQSDRPVREIDEAVGHAVRACYLYTAMAELAARTDDPGLLAACRRVFDNITLRKMSVTGGVGASMLGEAFDLNDELNSMTGYNETCAAIALALFAHAMQQHGVSSVYGDVIERVLYNGFLSGTSLEGDAFFYENALEIDLRRYENALLDVEKLSAGELHHYGQVTKRRLERAKVFSCFCCPPNIARTFASVTKFMYSVSGDTVYCHQFASAFTDLVVAGQPATLRQETDYPCDGRITFTYHGAPARLAVRIPGWCAEYAGPTENGYACFDVTDGASVTVELPMGIRFVEANPAVRDLAGRCAVTRGPVVYCMEGVDNGPNLRDVEWLADGPMEAVPSERYHAPVITMAAQRRPETAALYAPVTAERIPFTATLIPYYAFANRGASDMLIWGQMR